VFAEDNLAHSTNNSPQENAGHQAAHPESDAPGDGKTTQRGFVTTVGAVTGGMAVGVSAFSSAGVVHAEPAAAGLVRKIGVDLTVNGESRHLDLDPRVTLLDALREFLGLTGTKKGCDHGQCGACTVLVNGRRINSCLTLAVMHQGEAITTIEGLAKGDALHPLQAAFLEHDGLQCGYCTPGHICSAVALLAEAKAGDASIVTDLSAGAADGPADLTPDEIRERMSGNICRCGAYPGIIEAVRSVYRRA